MAQKPASQKWNDVFEGAMALLAVGCVVYFGIKGNGAKIFEPVLILIVLASIRLIVRWTRTPLFASLRFIVLLFIFVTMFLANEFGFYGIIPHLDKIEHFFSGVILTFIGLLIYRKATQHEGEAAPSARIAIWLSLFFAVAMAGVWEIFEYSMDVFFGTNNQNGSLQDTMTDIICGTIGATLAALYLVTRARKKRLPLIHTEN
ncbi:hypothetical protein [Paenibacillus whitsoniae]|uniref:DUF2238 domain-containing protein n=1 Tax=Paenibacillus whitsoniae TaxID=2496558 RepID=A0A430J5A6_9BACL|nr:hypothetical protein [Paenibacillus whitsoniae]RTE02999.1 hypothetical protein EJQ19_28595 [Paenibacillus whitsoniae]